MPHIGVTQTRHANRLTDIGRNIKRHQAARQMKQQTLADLAGIGKNTMTRLFYKTDNTTVGNITKVAEVLGVPVWELFLPPSPDDWQDI